MEDQDAYLRAKKRVEMKVGFYIHLAVYLGVTLLLIIINMSTSPKDLWFQWPTMGWGIGVFFHGLGVFVLYGQSAVIEKMIEKEIKKEASRNKSPSS